jgi:2,3-bisphosphoglycerate-dependent phosphoglycerate mutase
MAELGWLGVVRHGESTGNIAAFEAESEGRDLIDIAERDADVPLSDTGREQAAAVGDYLAELSERPQIAVVSPYLRTMETAELATRPAGIPIVRDERLRDRELGVLDLHTWNGVRKRLPDEGVRRARLGKFYYRPPGGESWADVALRLRSLLGDVRRDHDNGRVLLVSHEAIVYLLRYLIEGLTEPQLLTLTREYPVPNCSITTWQRDPVDGRLVLVDFARVEHLRREGVEATVADEVNAKPI